MESTSCRLWGLNTFWLCRVSAAVHLCFGKINLLKLVWNMENFSPSASLLCLPSFAPSQLQVSSLIKPFFLHIFPIFHPAVTLLLLLWEPGWKYHLCSARLGRKGQQDKPCTSGNAVIRTCFSTRLQWCNAVQIHSSSCYFSVLTDCVLTGVHHKAQQSVQRWTMKSINQSL